MANFHQISTFISIDKHGNATSHINNKMFINLDAIVSVEIETKTVRLTNGDKIIFGAKMGNEWNKLLNYVKSNEKT